MASERYFTLISVSEFLEEGDTSTNHWLASVVEYRFTSGRN